MGGGCQGKTGAVQYAHAVPPSWNAGAMVVLVQRAYFSAWRMVFEVPSGMSARMRALPCGLVVGGLAVKSSPTPGHWARNRTRRTETPSIVTTPSGPTLGIRRAKEDCHRLAVDVVVARIVHRGRSVRRRKRHTAQGAAIEVALLEIRQQVEKVGAKRAVRGGRIIPDAGRQMPMRVVIMVGGQAELLEVVGALDPAAASRTFCTAGSKQADQDGDDRDHDQQLDQREAAPPCSLRERGHGCTFSLGENGLP